MATVVLVLGVPVALRLMLVDWPGGNRRRRAQVLGRAFAAAAPLLLGAGIAASAVAGGSWESGDVVGPVAHWFMYGFAAAVLGLFVCRP